jgi:transporter family protein
MQWIFYAILSAFFAGLVALFGKIGISGVDSTLATAIRAGIMFVFLTVVVLAGKKLSFINQLDSKAMFFIILSGVAGALSWLAYFLALKYGKVSQVASIDRLSVVFAVVMAVLFLSEKVNWKIIIGMIAMVIGSILVALG